MNLFDKAFRGKTHNLIERLDVSLHLLCLLHDKELLTDSQKESVKVCKTNHEKVDSLLIILGRLDGSKFEVLCSALKTVGQSDIIEILQPDAEPTWSRPDTSQQLLSSTEATLDLTVDLEGPHISKGQHVQGEPVNEQSTPRGSVSSKVSAAISVSSQLSKDNILSIKLGELVDAKSWKMKEMIVIKAAIVFHQVYRIRLVPRSDVLTYVTVCSVCAYWYMIMTYRDYIRRHLRQLFQRKLLPSTVPAVASHAASSSSLPQAALKSVSIAPSVDLTVDLEATHISEDQHIPDEPHLVYGEHVSIDRSLKRRLEDAEPVQPTKRLTPSTEISDSSHHMDYNAISVSSQFSKEIIFVVPLVKPALPWEIVEMIVIKAAIVFHQVYRVRLVPQADVLTFVTVCSVCEEWHTIMTYREYNRRQLRQLFQRKLTGAVPLELLKASVLLRRLVIKDTSTSKPPKSDRHDVSTSESLESESDPDDLSTREQLGSERDADHKLLILLSSVCRHWCTTIKTRSHLSRKQLCLMLHDDGMRRLTQQLHKNRVQVIASLCVTDYLIHQIAAVECISDRQKKHLLTSPLSRRSSRLMNMMQLKNVQDYKLFIGVLQRTAREDIAVLLESTHVIRSDSLELVIDLTIMNDELFVLRGERKIIEVYSTTTFEKLLTFDVSKYGSDGWLFGCALTSCNINRCLYLCDCSQQTVYVIDTTGNERTRWEVGDGPRALYVSKSSNIIVTCHDTIKEYSPSGSLVNTVHLPSEVKCLVHTVDLSSVHYAVCHWRPVNGVSVVDKRGHVILTYRNNRQSNTRLLNSPRQLAVTSNNTIIVADSKNNRIISYNATLNCVYDMSLLFDYKLHRPCSVYYDESRSRLYVGEATGCVVVFDGISDIS